MMRLLYGLFICLIFQSCYDHIEAIPAGHGSAESHVNLSDLTLDQETRYIKYVMDCKHDTTFSWTGDTLVIRVVGTEDDLYLAEWITEHSTSSPGAPVNLAIYPIRSKNGVVTIPERDSSLLFNFYGSDFIHLNPPEQESLAQYSCLLKLGGDLFEGNEIGHINTFTCGPITIADKTVVSCVPYYELDAYLFYDRNQLFLSHQVDTEKFGGGLISGQVTGWKMLE